MRNLRNIHRSLIRNPSDRHVTGLTWDVASDSAICVFGPTTEDTLVELKRWRKTSDEYEEIAAWDAPCPSPDLDCDQVLDVHFFADSSISCIVFAGGDLVVVREEPENGEDKIEIVGSVDAGITAAAWSLDEELLAITTQVSTLLYMTKDFENIVDLTLSSDDLAVSQHVSVGWGKKETQFKGKKARALRDPTIPETVDEGILSDRDDGRTTISWRGDGQYLAINSVITEASFSRRVIRVFSREGLLDSVSEAVNGLEGALSWRPAGNLIAGVQRLDGLLKVVFFERNGLRHGQFDLRLKEDEASRWGAAISLQWTMDSSILSICFRDRLQLWTMGNYHYYVKQEIQISAPETDKRQFRLSWNPDNALHMLMQGSSHVERRSLASVVAQHPTNPPHDHGLIAVIDGGKLFPLHKLLNVDTCEAKILITPLRHANVPPPMALYELQMPGNAKDVATAAVDGLEPVIRLATLHNEGLSIHEFSTKTMMDEPPRLMKFVKKSHLTETDEIYENLQVSFVDETRAVVLQNGFQSSRLFIVNVTGDTEYNTINVQERIESIVPNTVHSQPQTVLMTHVESQMTGSKRVRSDPYLQSGISFVPFRMKSSSTMAINCCTQKRAEIAATLTNGAAPQSSSLVFHLAENGSLFANDWCLVRNCSSFAVTPKHLVFTTTRNLLKIVHVGCRPEDLHVPSDTPEADERCRSIESGAKIVSMMPTIFAVVLQMPRGNLETIYPRALVLAGIRDSIVKKKYRRALLACRAQRVDMNILYDYAPDQFIANIELFIDQVKKVEHIDLFLSQLQEQDVTKIMYEDTSNIQDGSQQTGAPNQEPILEDKESLSKVNRICLAFLRALKGRPDHTQNLISAFVCQNPPNLNDGLRQIAVMRTQKSDQVDTAVEHICFLADVNRLYDNALGLYDLELTLLIAQQSQKDPREYLPHLQRLKNLAETRRKFSIDDHLARYEKALDSLCQLDTFDEVKAYTIKHNLYTYALDHHRYQEQKYADILRLYAKHLESQNLFQDAALAYEYLREYTQAYSSYQRANLWKESLSCALSISLPQAQLEHLARDLVSSLIESKDFHAAATIQHEHLADVPTAVATFCKGYHFADALRVAALHSRTDLLESTIDPSLVDGMAAMTELIAECRSQLRAQVPRIRELRTKKLEDPLAFYDGDSAGGGGGGLEDGIPDDVSIASTDAASTTGGSLFTRYTNRSSGTLATNATARTSRNKRREERKRARGKKGSVYEEEYLVNSVRRLIERVNSTNEEVRRLVTGLVRRAMRERARAVESGMLDLVKECRASVGEAFGGQQVPNEEGKRAISGPSTGDGVGGEGQGDGSVVGQTPPLDLPIVKDFQKLSLVGGSDRE